MKAKTRELGDKLQLKRIGGEGFKIEGQELILQAEIQLLLLDPNNKTDKTKINALNRDKAVIEERITNADAVLETIGGQLTDDEAKHLILKKLYDIVSAELERYLNAEMRHLISGVENLWSKYASSSQKMERSRLVIVDRLDGFLKGLGYLK